MWCESVCLCSAKTESEILNFHKLLVAKFIQIVFGLFMYTFERTTQTVGKCRNIMSVHAWFRTYLANVYVDWDAFVVVREKSWLLYSGLFSFPFPLPSAYMLVYYLLEIGFSECLQQKTRKIKYNQKLMFIFVVFKCFSILFPLPVFSKINFCWVPHTLPSAWSSLSSSSYFLRIFALPIGFISLNAYFSIPLCRGQITE